MNLKVKLVVLMYYLKRGRERAKPENQHYSRPVGRGTRRAVKSGPTMFGIVAGQLLGHLSAVLVVETMLHQQGDGVCRYQVSAG
jgi:hypothetical protein